MQLSKAINLVTCFLQAGLCTAYGQIENTTGKYYELVNKAEMSICHNQLQDAYNYYSEAYKIQGDKMSSKHLYNFFAVSADLQKWDTCLLPLTELKKRGWQYYRYEQTINNHYPDNQEKMLKLYQQLKDIKPELDSDYLRKIEIMVNFDQSVNEYFRSANNGLLDHVGKDTLDKVTELHLVEFQHLFSQKFPTDKLLGRAEHPWGHLPYHVILVHNTQGSNFHYLDNVLLNGVINGNFAPEEYDEWLSRHYYLTKTDTILEPAERMKIQVPLFPYDFIVYHDSLFQVPFPTEKTALYDEERKKIPGLCSVEEQRAKIVFQYYHKKYHFVPDMYVTKVSNEVPRRIISRYLYVAGNK